MLVYSGVGSHTEFGSKVTWEVKIARNQNYAGNFLQLPVESSTHGFVSIDVARCSNLVRGGLLRPSMSLPDSSWISRKPLPALYARCLPCSCQWSEKNQNPTFFAACCLAWPALSFPCCVWGEICDGWGPLSPAASLQGAAFSPQKLNEHLT